MRRICLVVFAVGATLSLPTASHAGVLGVAENYNAFIFQDMGAQFGGSQGALAVGGDTALFDYDVGTTQTGGTNLVVGGGLSFASDQVNGDTITGNVISNGSIAMDNGGPTHNAITNDSFAGTGGPTSGGTIYYLNNYTNAGPNTYNTEQLSSPVPLPVDFGAAESNLTNISTMVAGLADTPGDSTSVDPLFNLTFTATHTGENIFSIDADDLSSASSISINLLPGAFAVINVTESPDSFNSILLPIGATTNGYDPTNVLWNFNTFTSMTILDSFSGSVLAPSADVTFVGGDLSGTLVANSLSGSGGFFSSANFDHKVFTPLPASIYAGLALLSGLGVARRFIRQAI